MNDHLRLNGKRVWPMNFFSLVLRLRRYSLHMALMMSQGNGCIIYQNT